MTSLEVCGAGLKHAGWEDYAFTGYIPSGRFVVGWSFARKQISRFARNDKVWGLLKPTHSAVAPDRRGIEFQIVAARMNACPDTNLSLES